MKPGRRGLVTDRVIVHYMELTENCPCKAGSLVKVALKQCNRNPNNCYKSKYQIFPYAFVQIYFQFQLNGSESVFYEVELHVFSTSILYNFYIALTFKLICCRQIPILNRNPSDSITVFFFAMSPQLGFSISINITITKK
jgi:hypothetical protein